MIKKAHIALILALAALSGCAKVEMTPAEQKAVVFCVGSYVPQTKAVSLLNDDISSFSSRGFLHAEGVGGAQDFFGAAGETISWDASYAEWAPSHDYYWPKSENSYINFISYRGGTPAIDYSETSEGWSASFAWSGATISTGDNYLWADMAWRYRSNNTRAANPSDGYWLNYVSEGVPTLFHHALAQVRFLARQSKASDGDVSWSVTVTGLSLAGVRNTGSLSLTNADPEATRTQAWNYTGWTGVSGSQTISATGLDAALGTEDSIELLGWQSVLPQNVIDSMTLTVNFSVTTTYDLGGGSRKVITEAASAGCSLTQFTDIESWDMNKRITYTVVINPDSKKITIIPTEKDWTIETEYPLNIE